MNIENYVLDSSSFDSIIDDFSEKKIKKSTQFVKSYIKIMTVIKILTFNYLSLFLNMDKII